MATLYISYYASVDKGCAGDPISTEAVTTSSTSALSAVVPSNAVVAELNSDTNHYYTIATGDPTSAATNSGVVWANSGKWIRVQTASRAALKIAARTIA